MNTYGSNKLDSYGNKMDILKKGYLIHKRHTKVYVILCTPLSISDVSTVYYSVFGGNGGLENRAAILGNIAFAAMEETPLLILLANEKEINRPIFIHFINVNGIDDEVKLGQACCMRLHTTKADFTFSASTSTEYQEWIYSFKDAFNKTHPATKRKTVNTDVDDVDDLEPENYNTVENIDPNMFIPYNPNATLGRTRSSNQKQEKPLFGRLFSQCIPDNANNNSSRQANSNKTGHYHYSMAASRNSPSSAMSPRIRPNYLSRSPPSNTANNNNHNNHPGRSNSNPSTPNTAAATPITHKSSIPIPSSTVTDSESNKPITRASLPPTIPTPINTTTTITTMPTTMPITTTTIGPSYSDMPPLSPKQTVTIANNTNTGLPTPASSSLSSPSSNAAKIEATKSEAVKTN